MDQKLGLFLVFSVIFGIQLVLVSSEQRNPLKNPRICGRPECDLETTKFGYKTLTRYKYDYIMHISSEFAGSGDNTSDLYLTGKVQFDFIKNCEGVLLVNEIKLKTKPPILKNNNNNEDDYDYSEYGDSDDDDLHPNSENLAIEIQKYELRFAFHDGIIGEICPEANETIWALNLKKGILSSIQNSMARFDIDLNTTETDISGVCNVQYTLEGSVGTSVIVRKEKDINSCINRYQAHSILQTTPYSFRENKVIWSILNSTSYCNHTIDHSIFQEITCFERHQMVPFSNNQTGAITESLMKLILTDEESYVHDDFFEDPAFIEHRSSLLFDHTPSPKPTHGEIKASRDLLKKMCKLGYPNIQRDFIDTFTKFLQTARLLSYKALHQLLARSSSICGNGKNHVLESLPYISSIASVQLMRDQLVGEAVPKEMAASWMASLSFLPRPDINTLETFYSLIEYGKKKNDPEYTLGATAVVHTFCRHHPNCENVQQIRLIIQHLEMEARFLFNQNRNQRKIKDRLIVLLKGLGNIGYLSEQFIIELKQFIEDDKIPVEIRSQSVLTFRRVECKKHSNFFMNVYQNLTANSEIRILSYVQTMRCPDYETIHKIKYILEVEEVNQVGSYVWSHLHNLAKSSSPIHVEIQGLLINDNLGTKYKLDIRKFSRNYEHSLFFDEYNFGTSMDADLIFGTDSYLPRIGSFNFTADLFGESVNFFEITTRMQGFDQLAASAFGPNGPFKFDDIRKKIPFLDRIIGDRSFEIDEDLLNLDKIRSKRKVNDDIDMEEINFNENSTRKKSPTNNKKIVENDIDKLGYKLKYNYNEPRLAFGLRIFGNDLKYYTTEGLSEVAETVHKLNDTLNIMKFLTGQEISYTKSGVFLDASYNVPMSSGLPLSVHAYGASSVDLRMSAKLKKVKDWQFDIQGDFKPSISVDVITSMETDLYYVTSGIRVKSNLYSSLAVEGNLKVQNKELISLTFSLPQNRNDIFSARSELLVVTELEEIPQVGIARRYSNSTCTWPIIDTAVGLKICSEYSLPDVSNSTNYPGVILSGPINLNVHLDKADPTATIFLFEYRWHQQGNLSNGSFVFETPGSAIPRILTANITRNLEGIDLSMIFKNGGNAHSAIGMYKGDPIDRELKLYVESNGKKSLDFEMNINRTLSKNGWLYAPKFLLSVNEDRIAGLAGTVKVTDKKGITQNDVNLTFETKKLQARLIGNIIKTEVSYSTKLKMDYRFEDKNIQTIELEGEVGNRSQKSKIEYKGDLKILTSAYPYLNFASNFTFLSILGHSEAKLTVNNAKDLKDPNFTTTTRLILTRSDSDDPKFVDSKTTSSLEIYKPKSNIDFKIFLKHNERHKNGPFHNILGLIRYAPQKEITSIFSIYFPRRNLFAMDATMNITVPAFDSCAVQLRLIEKNPKDYSINFSGTWFLNQSITIQGTYQDKSSRIRAHHQLKLLVNSSSFNETSINAVYRRNEFEIFLETEANHNNQLYGVKINYSARDEDKRNTYAEIKFRDRIYWMSSEMQLVPPTSLLIDMHIDKLRDIHFNIRGLSTQKRKEASMEIKWDANRDPTQKLAILAEFNNRAYKKYDGTFMLAYPERTFSSNFDVYTGGPNYRGLGQISWGPNEVIVITYDAGFIPDDVQNYWFKSELKTPFKGWKINKLESGIFYENNLLLVNGSLLWAEDQNVGIVFKGNYEISEYLYICEILMAVNSTLSDVPTVSTHFRHYQDIKKLITDIDIRYRLFNESMQTYSINSEWQTDKTPINQKIIGSIIIRSPFEGYTTGAMTTKFTMKDKRHIQGAAALTLEARKFNLALEGYVKKLTENGLEFNITTPIEKFRTIRGRFGINDKERHAVAEIRAPGGALGAEILLAIMSLIDFDIKLSLATPLEPFEKISVTGKMKPETVDLRGEWNDMNLGFTGVWRMRNMTDFEYSYKVFTPIEKFETNEFVVKLIKANEFNFEVFTKFAAYKFGVKCYAKHKPKIIAELSTHIKGLEYLEGLGLEFSEDEEFINFKKYANQDEDEDEDYYYDPLDIDYDNLLNYLGYMELDTLIWPTIKGNLDMEENGDTYVILSKIQLPQGDVDIKNRFYYPDYLKVHNFLKVTTPFQSWKEIKSKFKYSIKMNEHYLTGFDVSVFNNKTWMDLGYYVNYTISLDPVDTKKHNVEVILKSPMKVLRQIDINGFLELDENIYHGNFTLNTVNTKLSLDGSIESDDKFMDASIGLILETNVIPHYTCQIYFKKDLSEVENSVDLGFHIHDNGTSNRLRIEGMWHINQADYINAKGRIHTNILPLKFAEGSILLTKTPDPLASFHISMLDTSERRMEFRTRATRKKDIVNFELETPISDYRNITLEGRLTPESIPNKYKFIGKLYRNSMIYDVTGSTNILSDIPVNGKLILTPRSGGNNAIIQFDLKNTEGDYGKTFQMSIVGGQKMCQIGGGFSIRNQIDWNWSMLIESSEPEISHISLSAELSSDQNNQMFGNVKLDTPWKHLGIESVKLGGKLQLKSDQGSMQGDYEIGTIKGHGKTFWSWIIFENMQFSIESVIIRSERNSRVVQASVKYLNPGQHFQKLGINGKLNVDSLWIIEINGTAMYLSAKDISGSIITRLPEPIGDVHRLTARYRGNLMDGQPLDVYFDGKYDSDVANRRYGLRGIYRNRNDLQGLGRIEWGHDKRQDALECKIDMLDKGNKRKTFSGRLSTPFYNEDTLYINGSYDQKDIYHVIMCFVNYPESRQVADADMSISSLSNMKGHLNSTTPFLNTTWLKADFDFSTKGVESVRYMKATWPKNFAYFDHRNEFKSKDLDRDIYGTLKLDVPLTSRHIANIKYDLKERSLHTNGHANVIYNDVNVLNGEYTYKTEQRAGFEKGIVDISLENSIKPLGIHYIHSRQYGGREFEYFQTSDSQDSKHVEIFELRNSSAFNITGELFIRTSDYGQEYKIVAIHPNRTVIFTSEYNFEESKTMQKSKLQVAPNIWIGYNIKMENWTKATNDSQNFVIDISYPKRNLTAEGFYSVSEDNFDSNLAFKWTGPDSRDYWQEKSNLEPKVIRLGLQWKSEPLLNIDKDNQSAIISIGHPSFEKDVTIKAQLYRSPIDLIKTKVIIDYTNDPEHLLTLGASTKDLLNVVGYRNYTFELFAYHIISNLDLFARGSIGNQPGFYKTESNFHYQRGYLPLQEGFFLSLVDFNNKIIDYHRETPFKVVRLYANSYGSYPMYGVNATVWDSPELNSTGFLFVDLSEKLTRMEFNLTEDASQNLHMIGFVPDARSAYFDLWRNYEEIRVIDIASYIRMNHSRLVTGQCHWRPKLKAEIKDQFKSIAASFYDSFSDGIDFWIKTLYTEATDSLNDVWSNSKTHTQNFLNDLSALSVLEEDIEDFRGFVNQSYEANDFYIKTVVNFTLTVIDELAIRDHIESLPKILTEIWQVMGESGKALRKSVIWLIETIKTSYHKALEIISKFLHGESLEHLSAFMEKAVEKYDRFIKDLHISFIKSVENLWTKLTDAFSVYWRTILKRLEPHVFRFLHYIETALWNISKEIFDFIYKRTNELAETPYFNQVSGFTRDLDLLYKDLMANDAITNFKKYSILIWKFLKEKYFKIVPFGKELNDILTELWTEIKKLQKVESIQFIIQKLNEITAKLEWIAEEFEFDKRIHQIYALIRNKITTYSQTALEADDKYREAKTKFVFNPETGIMELEQKLPMSWHAFNETPRFEEIPEYKLLLNIQSFFSGSNFSLWQYIYSLRPHTDPTLWFPPYKAHSLLIGSRHYMTFDSQFVGLNIRYEVMKGNIKPNQCSFLLAHDFFNKNFSLVLEPSTINKNNEIISTRKLTLLFDKHLLEIDVTADTLRLDRTQSIILPAKFGNTIVSRDADVLTIESAQGFNLNCNLQFDLCWLELSGWYFGQTAGILGTMNNEPFDDYTNSNGIITRNEDDFINSWSMQNCKEHVNKNDVIYSSELMDLCTEFFKTPYFSNCFASIDPAPFYDMCLDMGSNSISTVIQDNHPAKKGACTAALGYIEACAAKKIPLRIPDKCVHCDLINGSYVPEGQFIQMEGEDVVNTTDVVFIVEAKPCNANITSRKNIMTVVNSTHNELLNANITGNRYAVLTFGGRAPFDKPRNIVFENKVFTNFDNLKSYFDHIETFTGLNNDIFEAISIASKLIFRPGASKTFILLPCSECAIKDMRFDYSSILQLMLEEGINLHILMDKEFVLDKARLVKTFYGMDRDYAYSRSDYDGFKADVETRKQVRLPKEKLGTCTALAIETNGSVFTARRLLPEKRNPIKKFATLFGRRIAKTAYPNTCQLCECTGHNTGVAYMTCTSCNYPNPFNLDYDFDETYADMNLDWEDDEDMI